MTSKTKAGLEIRDIGLTEVHKDKDAIADIILCHGLGGHPRETWTAENGVFWPAELLPEIMGTTKVRILVYGYNANVVAFGGEKQATSEMIHQHAETLVGQVNANRSLRECPDRPIIWLGHSLGGILIKRALNYSASLTAVSLEDERSVFVSTSGILFLGTPHNGAKKAEFGLLLQRVASAVMPKKILDTDHNLLNTLASNSETLLNINLDFRNYMERFSMYLFHENLKTDIWKFGMTFVVDEDSAGTILPGCLYAGIEANHTGMCKFASDISPGFELVAGTIKTYAKAAGPKVRNYWRQELNERERRRHNNAMNAYGGDRLDNSEYSNHRRDDSPHYTSADMNSGKHGDSPNLRQIEGVPVGDVSDRDSTGTYEKSKSSLALPESEKNSSRVSVTPAETVADIEPSATDPKAPPWAVPQGFIENNVFFGMKKELKKLDSYLFNKTVRETRSACVLLWCLPGGGKSYLARQYVFGNRHKFPGGVFWVQASSKAEIWEGFWNIAEKSALNSLQNPRTLHDEAEKADFVKAIKDWFEERHGWLLVFDGLTIDHDKQLTDMEKFIPSSSDSAIILTSVNRNLEGRKRLLYPKAIPIRPLDEAEAVKMLFEELKVRHPGEAEKQKALEIVRRAECLPLWIHAKGRHIKALGLENSILRYHFKSSPDQKIKDTYRDIFEDIITYGHKPARELINVLCFFARHIPYEMVHFGTKAFAKRGIEIKEARDIDSKPDLSATISTLLKYALVDRNTEPDPSISEKERGSMTGTVGTIDMLKVHSVVQAVCIDDLRSGEVLVFWLELAVKVFQISYYEANNKIKARIKTGLVSDYRQYEVNGKQLMDHLDHYAPRKGNERLLEVRESLQESLNDIGEEIQKRTPNVSQEAIAAGSSIFDRGSSTSSTGPETGPETPELSGLSIFPTYSTMLIDHDGMHLESPASIGTDSPMSKMSNSGLLNGHRNLEIDDESGYRTDDEKSGGVNMKTPSLRSTSRAPANPGSLLLDDKSRTEPLTIKPIEPEPDKHRTIQNRKIRRDQTLPSWIHTLPRVTPGTGLARVTANADIIGNKPSTTSEITARSEAEASLAAAQNARSPKLGQNGSTKDRRPSSQSRTSLALDVFRAAFLKRAREEEVATSPTTSDSDSEQAALPSSRDFSDSSLRKQFERSPLGSPRTDAENLPGTSNSSPGLRYSNQLHVSDPNIPELSLPIATGRIPYRVSQNLQGPNRAPLRFEEIPPPAPPSQQRRHSPDGQDENYQLTSRKATLPSYGLTANYARPGAFTGYTSQPLSRDVSHQSETSVVDSEPARERPLISPYLLPTDPTEAGRDGDSNRETKHTPPLISKQPTSRPSHALNSIGGWFAPEKPITSTPPLGSDADMQRSSSGPGFSTANGLVLLGERDPEPISITPAQSTLAQRAIIDEEKAERHRREIVQRFERQEFKPHHHPHHQNPRTPYPGVDPMPPAPVQWDAEERRARRRGKSLGGVNWEAGSGLALKFL